MAKKNRGLANLAGLAALGYLGYKLGEKQSPAPVESREAAPEPVMRKLEEQAMSGESGDANVAEEMAKQPRRTDFSGQADFSGRAAAKKVKPAAEKVTSKTPVSEYTDESKRLAKRYQPKDMEIADETSRLLKRVPAPKEEKFFSDRGVMVYDKPYGPGASKMKKGGAVKKMAKGGVVKTATKSRDGLAQRGKTRGKMY